MAETKLTYKGRPLVRVGDELYYGKPEDPYVIFMQILDNEEDYDKCKVHIQLLSSNASLPPKDRIVKESSKNGLYNALDIGTIWLERALSGK